MRISDLEFYAVEIPRQGDLPRVRSLIARLATDGGVEGWGEAKLNWRPSELAARRGVLLPLLAGRSLFEIEDLLGLRALRLPPLRSAIEMASWDAIGRCLRQPCCHLWGGAYRNRVPLAVRLQQGTPSQVCQSGRELSDRGFRTIVVSTAGELASDQRLLDALSEAIGGRVALRFDGESHYPLATARLLCDELDEDLLECLIDPISSNDWGEMTCLRRQTGVPLGAWRNIASPADVAVAARSAAVATVTLECDRVGGPTAARKAAAVAEAAGLDASICCRMSVGVAAAATLQIAASTRGFSLASELSQQGVEAELLTERLEQSDGMLTVPRGAGLGVEVDRAKLELYQLSGE